MIDTAPSAGWLEGREHVLPVRIYYEDTDFTGVVYHGNYVRYFERGRSDFLRVAGVHHADLLARDARDTGREAAPLTMADDALLLDTSKLAISDAVERAIALVKSRLHPH